MLPAGSVPIKIVLAFRANPQVPIQGRAIQFSGVHGNTCFHEAVNTADIVNMLQYD